MPEICIYSSFVDREPVAGHYLGLFPRWY